MFCVGYGIYTRELHKTLYYLFSPGPAVSCVGDKPVSHHEIYTLCSILQHFSDFDGSFLPQGSVNEA